MRRLLYLFCAALLRVLLSRMLERRRASDRGKPSAFDKSQKQMDQNHLYMGCFLRSCPSSNLFDRDNHVRKQRLLVA